jgi:hypothetical protein
MNLFFWRKPAVIFKEVLEDERERAARSLMASGHEPWRPATRSYEGSCPNWECHAQEEHTVFRLRERTHEISEYWQEYAGALERENKRYRRALQRSLAVIGSNLLTRQQLDAWDHSALTPTPGSNDFTQDIQYIHGLVPEFKYITHLAYNVSEGLSLSPEREALIGIISGKENE